MFQSSLPLRVIWSRPSVQHALPHVTALHDAHGEYREIYIILMYIVY